MRILQKVEAEKKWADRRITALNQTMLVLIKFRIRGTLRFLSHAETIKVFQRACVRAGIKLRYSEGFNPRPRLSLPLPRSVGVETDDDLFCLRVAAPEAADKGLEPAFGAERFKAGLSGQLPAGFELLTVSLAQANSSFQPCLAKYVLTVRAEYLNQKLKASIKRLLASENLSLDRRIDAKGNIRNVDVRPFVRSVELADGVITVECRVSSAGSIRVEEILKLLKLDEEKLAAPVRRTSVQWAS